MRRVSRSLVSLSLVLLLGILMLTGAPGALAQATPVSSAAEAEVPSEAAPCVPTDAASVDEVLPDGLVREMVFVTEVDSSDFFDMGPPLVPALLAMTSVICIEPNTTIITQVPMEEDTENIGQFYTTSIIVLSGELEIKLVEQCANVNASGEPPCEVTNGIATYRTADDRETSHDLVLGEWTAIPPGGIVTLADVTVSYRTGDSLTRLLTSGVWAETPPGGACSTGCGRWRNP